MKLAARIGISITEFWEMTPFELNIYAKVYAEKQKIEDEKEEKYYILNAYLTSRWVWQKQVDIKKYLRTSSEKKEMTDDEMLRRVKVLNAVMGGKKEIVR